MRNYGRFLTQKAPLGYLLVSLFSGLGSGFFYPLSGLFVVDALGASPLQMGIFLSLSILSGVLVSQRIAKQSDLGLDRRNIILASQMSFIVVMVLFLFIRNYYLALAVMVCISSFSAAAMPQTFAIGREYADKDMGNNGTLFLSLMRAMMSLSWVIGPPLAFIVKDAVGFNGAFMFAGIMMSVSVLIVWRLFPSVTIKKAETATSVVNHSWRRIEGVPMYIAAVFMLFWANNMYVTTIPLYVSKELIMGGAVAGQLLGLAAFVEIPVMILAGLWATRVDPQRLMILGVTSACLFYTLLWGAEELWQMYALQLLNGTAVGICAGLGMVVIQNKMSTQMGVATTLFNNAIMVASLISSVTVGVIAQFFDYHSVIGAMILVGLVAMLLLMLSVREKKQPCPPEATAEVH
ncbi:sugar efflux transporter [Enterovibrio norvegicus]|uniref:sugar efflux transporter n=1 Tax=Enterovibrio norvegicus TaxID=188144 RepID=UPI00031B264E|nr:sugar efflux transporter [Enterovibrio norvegicus]OEE61915.1 MFS transporter [Enterovibrio norvegicus]TKF32130.1 MFS transporter [Enterovibrio norvegicus]